MHGRFPSIALAALLLYAASAGADPRWWWDDRQVSFGGPVTDVAIAGDRPLIAWIEYPAGGPGSLWAALSWDGGANFCPPLRLSDVEDGDAEVAASLVRLGTRIPESHPLEAIILLADGGRLNLTTFFAGDWWSAAEDGCSLLPTYASRAETVQIADAGAAAPALDRAYPAWRHTAPGGEQEIHHLVPQGSSRRVVSLTPPGTTSGSLGRPSVSVGPVETPTGFDAAINVVFADLDRGSVLYLRSIDGGYNFSDTGALPVGPPGPVNAPVAGEPPGPLSLGTNADWQNSVHGVLWFQDLGPAGRIWFDARFQAGPVQADPDWGPDVLVENGPVPRPQSASLVLGSTVTPDPVPVFLFWDEAPEIVGRGGILDSAAPEPIDLDTYPIPPVRPTDPSTSVNEPLTACSVEEATGACLSVRTEGSARQPVSSGWAADGIHLAWIDDRTGPPQVFYKRSDSFTTAPFATIQTWCPAPDQRAATISFHRLERRPGLGVARNDAFRRFFVYYGRTPGGPYENTDLDGSDPGVPDTITLEDDGTLPEFVSIDIPGLQADTNYVVILVPQDEAGNLDPPMFDPLAGNSEPLHNETVVQVPATCSSTCGPFAFGGVRAREEDCSVRFDWQPARGEGTVRYAVRRNGQDLVTGLTGTSWTDTDPAGINHSYEILATDECADPGPRQESRSIAPVSPADVTPPEITGPVLTQTGPCTVRVEASATDACSGVAVPMRVYRNGGLRPNGAPPVDDFVPGDGTYTYTVDVWDRLGNLVESAPVEITVTGCDGSGRCLYRDGVWADREGAWAALGSRNAEDIALFRTRPGEPCPFPSGDPDPDGWFLPVSLHRLTFYQVEGPDIRDLRVTKDTAPVAVLNVRIFY